MTEWLTLSLHFRNPFIIHENTISPRSHDNWQSQIQTQVAGPLDSWVNPGVIQAHPEPRALHRLYLWWFGLAKGFILMCSNTIVFFPYCFWLSNSFLLTLHTHVSLYYLRASVFLFKCLIHFGLYPNVWYELQVWLFPYGHPIISRPLIWKKKKINFPHGFVWKLPFSWNNFPDVVGSISEFSFGPVGLSVYSCANTKLLITGIVVYVDGEELCCHMALLLGSSGLLCLFCS